MGTEQGLTLICYLHSSDVCIIAWSGSHHNGTVGLLGTNDLERYTDRRKPAGTIAESFAELLSTYAVSGPAECHGIPMPKQAPQQDLGPALCNKELHQKCVETFTSSIKPAYDSCPYYLSTSAFQVNSKTCAKWPLSKRPKIGLQDKLRLMQVKSIAECSKGSILQYFQPSLSNHLSLRYLFCLFLSGWLRQILLYMHILE